MTKTITPVSFFFGANNKSKYVSLFSDMYDPKDNGKHYILKGGPGTGKSVLAINLLVELTKRGMTSFYVTKNAAPRNVFKDKLKGSFRKNYIDNLFQGSGAFTEAISNEVNVLVVDEAHRLNEKSGMFQNLGENQVKEIINASNLSIFFIDENQKVTLKEEYNY